MTLYANGIVAKKSFRGKVTTFQRQFGTELLVPIVEWLSPSLVVVVGCTYYIPPIFSPPPPKSGRRSFDDAFTRKSFFTEIENENWKMGAFYPTYLPTYY